MGITQDTTINKLLDQYPYLLDYLLARSPKYKKLSNPLLRRTMGAVATVAKAAQMADIDPAQLVDEINEQIRQHGGGAATEETADKREQLKGILRDLHAGGDRQTLKERFRSLLLQVSPTEIAELEQGLIDEGLPQEEIKNLSSIHLEIFRETLEDNPLPQLPAGHPIATFVAENREATALAEALAELVDRARQQPDPSYFQWFATEYQQLLDNLAAINLHYQRKENQLFPFLEKRGLSGPAQVMWALHDDVRGQLKQAADTAAEVPVRLQAAAELAAGVRDMVLKEELILFPMALDLLDEADWRAIRQGEESIGYAWVEPGTDWSREESAPGLSEVATAAGIPLAVGTLSAEMINLMLTHLPVDITLVDADDRVAYFSQGKERIFPRSPGIIGREVRNCHPPKSVHVVEDILARFKSGERNEAEFWLELGGKFIHIRYFALRDGAGAYRGCLEVSQDVTGIRALTGQRRLLEWD